MADSLLRIGRGPSPREMLAVGVVITAVGVAAYLAYVLNGGFYSDDWANAAGFRFADPPRYWSSVSDLAGELGGRPLLALLLPLPHALFGVNPTPQLALALALGIATSLCLYALLRTLEMATLHAGAIAALALLFPWSDSIRLWSTASINTVSVCLLLLGIIVALRGLARGGRAGIAIHGVADLLFLLSILTYEATAAAALLAGLLYRGRASPSTVLRRWGADAAVVLVALVYSLEMTVSSRHVGSAVERLEDIGPFAKDSLILLASAIQPFGSPGRALQAVALAAVAVVVAVGLLRLRREDDQAIAYWLRWIAIAAVALAAAYFMFLGSHLQPRDPGIDNRINVLAGLAYALLAYAVIACACQILINSRVAAAAAAVSIAAVVGIGYAIHLAGDQSDWRDAATRQAEVLDTLDHRLPPLPPGSTILSFGAPAQVAPAVPVFDHRWDLTGALRIRRNTSSLQAFPIFDGVEVGCARELSVNGGGGYGAFAVPYRRLYFVGPSGSTDVRSRAGCERALRSFRPGPLES